MDIPTSPPKRIAPCPEQKPPMSHRDRILAAVNHQPLDRSPPIFGPFLKYGRSYGRILAHRITSPCTTMFNIDGIIDIRPKYIGPPVPNECDGGFKRDFPGLGGCGTKDEEYNGGVYWETIHSPLAEAQTIADLKAYQWPDPDSVSTIQSKNKPLNIPGRAILSGYYCMFYYHNQLRGLEASFMDPALRPEFTHYFLQRLGEFFHEYHSRIYEAAADVIDFTHVTDDYGSQMACLVSQHMFDAFYREPTQKAIDLAKSYGIHVFHHDDGDIRKLLPRFVEMGMEVLNPIQSRCGDWDLDWLKDEFGQDLCFHGGIDNQFTCPFGTPDEVMTEVRRYKAYLRRRWRAIIAPCHNIQANTPVENILAMYQAVNE